MVEPPKTRPPPHVVGAERDVLLATKLHVPQPRPGFLPRPRLLERLTQGTARELVLVCTPAGFGKTSLLADWARRSGQPAAWLSLDPSDNDPARFWRHAAAALDTARSGIADRVAPLLQGLQSASFEGVAAMLVNELAGGPDEVVLVLDDYHLIQAPPIHASLGFLVEHLPASLRLVLTSRTDPPLRLARLRARGQLTELRAADLRFTPEEVGELLRTTVGAELPEAAVVALGDRTEGWVAGLQLAALSLRGHADIDAFMEGFSGSHRYVLDYLTEEVLAQQPEHLVAFLLETSVLERLCGPLCQAVTGRSDSQQLLEQIERANLFLMPLDEVRGWWRYHHLFADLLQARLQQAQPDRVSGLHRAAAGWCETHELADDAIRHALAADNAGWAARLTQRHLEEQILRRNEGATLARWLTALPSEVLHGRPRLSLGQAIIALQGGRLDEAEPLLAAAERAFEVADDEPYEPSIGRAASILANIPAMLRVARADLARQHGDAEREASFARDALAHLTNDDQLLGSLVRYHLAVADWMDGRLGQAERALDDIVAERSAAGERTMAMRACYDLGHLQQAQGRLDAALGTYQRGMMVVSTPGHLRLPSAGAALVGLAEVLCERDELEASLEHATAGVILCRQLAFAPPLAAGLATLARICHAQGDSAGAVEAISEAERVLPGLQAVDLLNPVPALGARLALANGELAAAARWVRARGLTAEDEPSYPREREYLVLTRVLLAQDRPDQALGLLERLHNLAAAQQRTGSLIEIQALQALALAASGEEQGALATLGEALRLAAPEGYVRVFVDEGAPTASLLGRLTAPDQRQRDTPAGDVPPGYLARLLASFPPAAARVPHRAGRAVAVPGLVEPLSERELEVLQLLATGRSNQQIAEELVVALDTVKKHVSHLLDKLGVANRTQAVARPRQLQLLRSTGR